MFHNPELTCGSGGTGQCGAWLAQAKHAAMAEKAAAEGRSAEGAERVQALEVRGEQKRGRAVPIQIAHDRRHASRQDGRGCAIGSHSFCRMR